MMQAGDSGGSAGKRGDTWRAGSSFSVDGEGATGGSVGSRGARSQPVDTERFHAQKIRGATERQGRLPCDLIGRASI